MPSWRDLTREWLSAILIFCLAVLVPGCQFQLSGGDGLGITADDSDIDPKTLTGLLINDSSDDSVVLAARGEPGAFFVFGARGSEGEITRVDQILMQEANGDESFLAFEGGRPVHAQGPDGSYINVVYDTVTALQLVAQVRLFNAATEDVERYTVEVDLRETAQAIADRVREATGVEVATTDITAGVTLEKDGTDQTRVTVFSPLFSAIVLPFVALVNTMTVILGQILTVLSAVVTTVVYSVLLVALSPFVLVAELMRDAVLQIRIIPLFDAFVSIPPPNVITLAPEL